MEKITAFSMATPDIGYRNQVLGALNALYDITGGAYNINDVFILLKGAKSIDDVKETLKLHNFKTYKSFKNEVFPLLDNYFSKINNIPNVFVAVYNMTETANPETYIDMLCHAVKDYYKKNELGKVFTTVLTSKPHDYKYVDLINVPKHLMTFSSRVRLLNNRKLRKKMLITVGTINNFSILQVDYKHQILLSALQRLEQNEDADIQGIVNKLNNYMNKTKKIVFCLGGRTEGTDIIFDISYANKLYNDAENLVASGFGVVFVNGPRTPNNVIDFLYKKCLENPSILFYNCKKVAETEDDHQRWRIYSGKYEDVFRKNQVLGNIYPGILGFPNTMVVHTADSYACCETASVGIVTSISSRGCCINPKSRYDCLNMYKLLYPKYVADFDEFLQVACKMKIEPKDVKTSILSNPLRAFAECVFNRLRND